MTFLNPAILFGLLAASIPIVLHFLNLRKLKKVEFSTLAFLKELQKTKIKRIKLKQWLLLLLRIAIISFLVAAFARPTVKNFSVGNSSAAKTTAVIILDNTFSMSVVAENGSYLNLAKRIAKNLLNNFQEGDEIAVISAGGLNAETAGPTTNFRQVLQSIDDLQLSSISATLNEAVIRTSQIIYQSKNFNKEVYIFTDLQRSRIYNTPKDLTDLSRLFGDNTRIFLVDAGGKETVNLGVESMNSNNQILDNGKTVSFKAEIKNYSLQPVKNSVASLLVNGIRSAQQSINLAGGEAKEFTFETTLKDTGLVEFTAELEDDEILRDNKRYFSAYVSDRISLLMPADNEDDTKYIRYAVDDPLNRIKIRSVSSSQLREVKLKNYDAVILLGTEKNSDWNNLIDYVNSGGKVIVMPGSESTLLNYQKFCSALKIPAPAVAVGKIDSAESSVQFDKIDLQNTLFADLFENNKQHPVVSPDIYYYFKNLPGGEGKTLISMPDNSAFLSEYQKGKGKILLFNSAPVLGWNDFPLKGLFAPLMNKLILYSASKVKEDTGYLAGQEIYADISNHSIPQIVAQKPGGGREFINADSLTNKNYLPYSNTDETGTYKFYSGGKMLDYFSVNHDPRESDPERFTDSVFKDYLKQIGFGGKLITLSAKDNIANEIYQSRFGTEFWRYLLIAVLLLALIESFVARSSKKELAEIKGSEPVR